MPWTLLAEVPKGVWAFVGSLAGATVVLIVGWWNVRHKDKAIVVTDRDSLTKDQLALIEMLRKEVESMHARLADMDIALRQERQSCDERMSAIEQRHQKKMAELEVRLSRTEAEDQEK